MASLISRIARRQLNSSPRLRNMIATQANAKKEGDISSVFASLSGAANDPLPERFARLKQDIIRGKEDQITASWNRLLHQLQEQNEIVAQRGPSIIPQIHFKDIVNNDTVFRNEVRNRGVAVV